MNNIGILFDLDGVLVDSEGEYTKFWGGMGERYGLVPTFAADIKGTTIGEILLNFPEADREWILGELHAFEADMQYPVYPGVMEFLRELKESGVPSAIVTSSDNVKMDLLFVRRPELRGMIDDSQQARSGGVSQGCRTDRCTHREMLCVRGFDARIAGRSFVRGESDRHCHY